MRTYVAWWTIAIALLVGVGMALTMKYKPADETAPLDLVGLARSEDTQRQLEAITQLSDRWHELPDYQQCEVAASLLQADDPIVRQRALTALFAVHGPETKTLPPLAWVADDHTLARRLILASQWTETPLHWPKQQPIPTQLHDLINPETGQTKPARVTPNSEILPVISTNAVTPSILTAIHAEQVNSPKQNRTLCNQLLTDLNDRNKQSGALLAALTNDNLEDLQAAFTREENPKVRATQYLALAIAGINVNTTPQLPPAAELAWRSMHQEPDGSLDINMLAAGLALGERSFLETLVNTEPSSKSELVQRAYLLQRFAPPLALQIGLPPTDDEIAINRYQDALVALYELSSNQLAFNQDAHRFERIAPESSLQDNASERQPGSYDCVNNDHE